MRKLKLLAITVSFFLFLSTLACLSYSANATGNNPQSEDVPQIVIQNATGYLGETVSIQVLFRNNPGITSAKLSVSFPDGLTLTDVTFGNIGGMTVTSPTMNSPLVLNWFLGNADIQTSDFIFATLTFEISDTAEAGLKDITVQYSPDDIFNLSNNNVEFAKQDGGILVREYIPGDINGDNAVNNRDLSALIKYLIGEDVQVKAAAVDVNDDGEASVKDLMRLYKYLSGWDIDIH